MRTEADLSESSAVRRLREATFKPSYVVKGIDFNLESLCKFIETGASCNGGSDTAAKEPVRHTQFAN